MKYIIVWGQSMEEKVKQKRLHKICMENRSKLEMTGICDVVSFDVSKVVLESDYGMITIKGKNLHVNRLSLEKGELDIDGSIEAFTYSEINSYAKKGESMLGRLFR
jgi:sporulation protein YabP